MIEFICFSVAVAMNAAFVISLLDKWGAIEYVQINGSEFFAKMFSCQFCLSWWACVTLAILLAIAAGNATVLLTPFVSTMITRRML